MPEAPSAPGDVLIGVAVVGRENADEVATGVDGIEGTEGWLVLEELAP